MKWTAKCLSVAAALSVVCVPAARAQYAGMPAAQLGRPVPNYAYQTTRTPNPPAAAVTRVIYQEDVVLPPNLPQGRGVTAPDAASFGQIVPDGPSVDETPGSGVFRRGIRPPAEEHIVYARAEYLLWWLKGAPNPNALVTTGDPNIDPTAGILGSATTRVLFGGKNIDLDTNSGGRVTVGGWLDDIAGVEGSGFLIADRGRNYRFASDNAGNPLLGVPFLNLAGQEQRLLVANPSNPLNPINQVNFFTGVGSVTADHTTEFWGADGNLMFKVARTRGFRFDALAGFMYRQLRETYSLQYALAPVDAGFLGTFGGNAQDIFATTNDFFGGQVGARAGYQYGMFSIEVTGKLGIGANRQELDIAGGSTFNGTFGPPFNRTSPYGVFAQQSNIGTYHEQRFTLIPEVNAQVGIDVTRWLKIFAGYNFMYWSNVIRPGNQIDRTINTNAGALNQDFFTGLQRDVPPLGGRPAPLLSTTDFWAHGINCGIELRY